MLPSRTSNTMIESKNIRVDSQLNVLAEITTNVPLLKSMVLISIMLIELDHE
jgi:hypothetical protein